MNSGINYIKVESGLNWDDYFMLLAMITSFKSKDPATKVGCVIVDSNQRQVTMGYNGMVAGIDESKLPWGKDKSVPLKYQKYGYVVHSETNAILHAPRSLEDCRMYVTLFPCNECAKLIASKKIKEVIYLSDKHKDQEGTEMAKYLFDLANITYRQLIPNERVMKTMEQHLLTLLQEAL
ncbi:MAG: dCMP deaminase family protein [Bdellovibrio sp.]|nr:dCMP deaminase family protein [Bdellovibrio sp.]